MGQPGKTGKPTVWPSTTCPPQPWPGRVNSGQRRQWTVKNAKKVTTNHILPPHYSTTPFPQWQLLAGFGTFLKTQATMPKAAKSCQNLPLAHAHHHKFHSLHQPPTAFPSTSPKPPGSAVHQSPVTHPEHFRGKRQKFQNRFLLVPFGSFWFLFPPSKLPRTRTLFVPNSSNPRSKVLQFAVCNFQFSTCNLPWLPPVRPFSPRTSDFKLAPMRLGITSAFGFPTAPAILPL